jgi:hypothetical protein
MALDAQSTQFNLDDIEAKYQQGLITVSDKLEQMINLVENHITFHLESQSVFDDDKLSSYERAEKLLRQLHRIERYKNKLDLFVK